MRGCRDEVQGKGEGLLAGDTHQVRSDPLPHTTYQPARTTAHPTPHMFVFIQTHINTQ